MSQDRNTAEVDACVTSLHGRENCTTPSNDRAVWAGLAGTGEGEKLVETTAGSRTLTPQMRPLNLEMTLVCEDAEKWS